MPLINCTLIPTVTVPPGANTPTAVCPLVLESCPLYPTGEELLVTTVVSVVCVKAPPLILNWL